MSNQLNSRILTGAGLAALLTLAACSPKAPPQRHRGRTAAGPHMPR